MSALRRRLLRGQIPEPRADLREQVLRAAAEAARRQVDSVMLLDRLWEMRDLLVAALVVLMVAHLAVSSISARWEQEWGWTRPAPNGVASWTSLIGGDGW